MSDCFFCGDFVGEVNGDGGAKGRSIGNKDICEQCLGEFKHWLNGTLPRSPGMRERKLVEEDDVSSSTEETVASDNSNDDASGSDSDDESNPFSSGAKI